MFLRMGIWLKLINLDVLYILLKERLFNWWMVRRLVWWVMKLFVLIFWCVRVIIIDCDFCVEIVILFWGGFSICGGILWW